MSTDMQTQNGLISLINLLRLSFQIFKLNKHLVNVILRRLLNFCMRGDAQLLMSQNDWGLFSFVRILF